MAISVANFTRETSSTSGTGTYNLGGATGRYQTFVDAVGDGATVYYHAFDDQDFESGIGTITDASPDTLSRDTILESSNADAAVSWPASGQRTIIMTAPASKTVLLDENGDVLLPGNLTVTGQGTINPASALPPLVLNANAQGQKVVGLNADDVDGKGPATTAVETGELPFWSTDSERGIVLTATADGGVAEASAPAGISGSNLSISDLLAKGPVSTDPGLAFDTWRTPNASRPTLVFIEAEAVSNGVVSAWSSIQVDDSGGTSLDYEIFLSFADELPGDGFTSWGSTLFFVRAGASYRIRNGSDPKSINQIGNHQEYTL